MRQVHRSRLGARARSVRIRGGEADLQWVRPTPCRSEAGRTVRGRMRRRWRRRIMSHVLFVGGRRNGEGGRRVGGRDGRREARVSVVRIGEAGAAGIAGRVDGWVVEGEHRVRTLVHRRKARRVERGERRRASHALPPRRKVELSKHIDRGGIETPFMHLDIVQEGGVTAPEYAGTLLIECGWRDEGRDRRDVATAPLENRRLEYGGVAGREVGTRGSGGGAGGEGAPRSLEVRLRGGGAVAGTEVARRRPALDLLHFASLLLLAGRFW